MWFLLLVGAIGLLGIVAVLAIFLRIWRTGRIGKIATAVVAAGALYEIYTAVYPPESFYKGEFEKVTGLAFPNSGSFLFKEASYPDIHGDYDSCAMIEVSAKDYEDLRSKIKARTPPSGPMGSECSAHLFRKFGDKPVLVESFTEQTGGEYSYWALVAGHPEVIVLYSSW